MSKRTSAVRYRLATLCLLLIAGTPLSASADEAFHHYKQCMHAMAVDNHRRALPEINKAIKLKPKEKSYLLARASVEIGAQNYVGAEKDCNAILKMDPNFGPAYSRRGYARLLQRKLKEGIADLDMAIKLNQVDVEIWGGWLDYVNRAQALEMTRQFQRAADIKDKETFRRGEKAQAVREELKTRQAVAEMDAVVKANPRLLSSRLLRGIYILNNGENSKAVEDFNYVISKSPKSPVPYYFRADAYVRLNQTQKAIADYSTIVSLNPTVVVGRGTAETGRCKGEQKAYDNNPVSVADVLVLRASLYKTLKKLDLALKDINKALELEPNDADALMNRAYLFDEKGNVDLALADIKKAITLEPENWSLLEERSHLYEKSGQAQKAVDDLSTIISMNPEESGSYLLRGKLYDRLKQYDNAIKDYSRVIKSSSDEVAYLLRAEANFNLGKHKEAIADCNKAIAIDKESAGPVYALRAKIYEKMGKLDLAKKDKALATKWVKAPTSKN